MSTNCIVCVKNERTGFDNLCTDCRMVDHKRCQYFREDNEQFTGCPVFKYSINKHIHADSICGYCLCLNWED